MLHDVEHQLTEMGKPLIETGVPARIPIGRAGTGDESSGSMLDDVAEGSAYTSTLHLSLSRIN